MDGGPLLFPPAASCPVEQKHPSEQLSLVGEHVYIRGALFYGFREGAVVGMTVNFFFLYLNSK